MFKWVLTSARVAALLILPVALLSCSSSDNPTDPEPSFTVVESFPADGATDVPVGTQIWVRFSASVDPNSVSAGQNNVTSNADGVWSAQGSTVSLIVEDPLETAQLYTMSLTTGVMSADGKPLAAAHSWSFTTESEAVPRPQVVSVTPANGATDVDPGSTITARFDRLLDPATVVAGQSFTVAGIAGSVVTTDSIAVFTPDEALPSETVISINLSTTIQDTDGAAMANPFDWGFETAFVIEPWEQGYGTPRVPFREKTYFSHVAAHDANSYYGYGVDNLQAYVVKTDVNGDVTWSRTFGAALSYTNEAFVALDDGCLFAYTNRDVGVDVVRLNAAGGTQLETTLSEVGTMQIYDMIEASDGNFVMAGTNIRTEDSVSLMTFWSAKIDANANVLWQHAYPDSVEITEVTGIAKTPDGGFMIMGSNQGLDGRGILMRTDSAGERIWVKKLVGDILNMTPYAIVPANDGGYVVAGTHLLGAQAEGFFAKLDENGDVVWSYYGGDAGDHWAYSMKLQDLVAVSGGYVAAGQEGPAWNAVDALLVMFDNSGNIVWEERIGGPKNEYLRSVAALPSGELLGAGYSDAFTTVVDNYQAYMLKHIPVSP